MESETGRVKTIEELEDEDFLKVLQKEAKKKKNSKRAPPKAIHEELLEMQKAQLKSLEDLEKRQQDFLEKIIEEQRKEDVRKKKKIANFL